MPRFIKLIALHKRGGSTYVLKDRRYTAITTMTLNPSTGLHESEMPEADFLKHARLIAELASTPGLGVYVGGIRDDASLILPPAVQEFIAGYNLAMDGKPLPDAASDSAKAGHIAATNDIVTTPAPPDPESAPEVDRIGKEAHIRLSTNPTGGVNCSVEISESSKAETGASLHDQSTGDPVETNLEDQGYNELKEIARGLGCFRVGMSKETLIEAIRAAQKPQSETTAVV